jgi:hypothetical protein
MDRLGRVRGFRMGEAEAHQRWMEGKRERMWRRYERPSPLVPLAGLVALDPADTVEARVDVARAMDSLDDTERRVIEVRYGVGGRAPLPLREAAKEIGRSPERVRQIEARALQRLAQSLAPPSWEHPTTPQRETDWELTDEMVRRHMDAHTLEFFPTFSVARYFAGAVRGGRMSFGDVVDALSAYAAPSSTTGHYANPFTSQVLWALNRMLAEGQ